MVQQAELLYRLKYGLLMSRATPMANEHKRSLLFQGETIEDFSHTTLLLSQTAQHEADNTGLCDPLGESQQLR